MKRQNRIKSRSAAFTLVELLVVITIIGMLMALLLPAVQSAREAGRRAVCQSNQKNAALGMINFESAKKHFPGYLNGFLLGYGTPKVSGGTVSTPVFTAPVSWVVSILPYMDRRDLHDSYKAFLQGTGTSGLDQFSDTSLAVLLCPSDPADSVGPNLAFVVNRGVNGQDHNPALGVCFDLSKSGNSKVSADYISAHDGTSTTLLVAESILSPGGSSGSATGTPPSPPRLQLIAADGTTAYYYRPISKWFDTANTSTSPLSWKGGAAAAVDGTDCASRAELSLAFDWYSIVINSAGSGASASINQVVNSRHGGIITASFCDGHQAPIRDEMDINTFKHLTTPSSSGALLAYPAPAGPLGILSEGDL